MRIAFLSQQKLFTLEAGQKPRPVESQFGNRMVQRSLQQQEKNAWKSAGNREGFFGGHQLWGVAGQPDGAFPVRISAVVSGADGDLIYALETPSIGGLFIHHRHEAEETRLFHREAFSISELDRHGTTGQILGSMRTEPGTANLALSDREGRDFRKLTEGDSVDAAPSWVEGSETLCVYQSAGVGRDAAGQPRGLGAFCIERLNLESGNIETLLESPETDFLLPHQDAGGNLYFIRRPYQGPDGPKPSAAVMVKDAVLFPFRLARAVVHFLNVFSVFFSKRPLMTAGTARRQEGPQKDYVHLWGRWIDTEAELRKQGGEAGNLVPSNWELVRRPASGGEAVLARHVLSYDLAADGTLVYTNGSRIYAGRENDFRKIGDVSGVESVKII